MIIVATTSLPAVDHPNADRWNAVRLCQNDGFSVFQALDDDYCTYSYTTVAGLLWLVCYCTRIVVIRVILLYEGYFNKSNLTVPSLLWLA